MTEGVLSVFAASGIQRYVFRSNKLKENVGASVLVQEALGESLAACARARGGVPVYVGGGKAAWVFPPGEGCREATFDWSRDALRKCPGLRLAAAHEEFSEGGVGDAHGRAKTKLDSVIEAAPSGSRLLALPIVRTCATTGLPASEREGKEFLSAESATKRLAADRAPKYFEALFARVLDGLVFPIEIEELGGRPGSSHVAVVHADGNGIGARLGSYASPAMPGAEFRERIVAFSDQIRDAGRNAFMEVLAKLKRALPRLERKGLVVRPGLLPIRPLVVGGDDLTFLCDGRLGLSLATTYLEELEKQPLPDGKPMDACAGVVIVRGHYPFARAYTVAAELCASAKATAKATKRQARQRDGAACGSWIDFQIVRSGSTGSVASSRRSGATDPIHRRPWPLRGGVEAEGRPGWTEFQRASRTLGEWPRSRAKALLAAFEEGDDAIREQLARARARGIEPPADLDQAFLYDPLDAMDFFEEA